MKRRIIMVTAAVIGVFAVENVADLLISRFIDLPFEVITWALVALICAGVVYELGEDRGDW